jgi:hypothetical protein
MGFFSWETADTKESIPAPQSHHPLSGKRDVFLLKPGGGYILGGDYDGYGRIDGKEIYEEFGKRNFSNIPAGDKEAIVSAAISLDCDRLFKDTTTGTLYSTSQHLANEFGAEKMPFMWEEPWLDGKTNNQLVEEGRFVVEPVELKFHIKLSFDKNANYDDLPPSRSCPDQGFFYSFWVYIYDSEVIDELFESIAHTEIKKRIVSLSEEQTIPLALLARDYTEDSRVGGEYVESEYSKDAENQGEDFDEENFTTFTHCFGGKLDVCWKEGADAPQHFKDAFGIKSEGTVK